MQHKKRRSSGEGLRGLSNEEEIWSMLSCMKKEIELLKQKIDNILPNVLLLTKAVEALQKSFMTSKEETTRIIVSEIMKSYKAEVGAREPKRMTEVRSNSAHFDGVPEGQRKENRKCEEEKMQDGGLPNTVGSDCSVSPLLATKIAQKNKKKKRTPITAPKSLRRTLKFNSCTNGSMLPTKMAGPFFVNPTTPKEDIDLLDFIFMDRPRTNSDSSMYVIQVDKMFIKRTEMQEFRPTECISNFIVDTFVCYMNEPDNVDWYFNSNFGLTCFHIRHPEVAHDAWIENTRNIANLHQFKGRLKKCEKIFIPMLEKKYIGDVGHWYLVIIHMKDRYAKILDSAPWNVEQRQRDARRVMLLVGEVFEDEFMEADAPEMVGRLHFKDPEDFGPRQPNSFDCGVFLMRNMQKYGTDWAAKYDSNTERASLVIELLRNGKNEIENLQLDVDRLLLQWRTGKAGIVTKKHDGVSLVEVSSDTTQKQV